MHGCGGGLGLLWGVKRSMPQEMYCQSNQNWFLVWQAFSIGSNTQKCGKHDVTSAALSSA